jgi:hypothetical protein
MLFFLVDCVLFPEDCRGSKIRCNIYSHNFFFFFFFFFLIYSVQLLTETKYIFCIILSMT